MQTPKSGMRIVIMYPDCESISVCFHSFPLQQEFAQLKEYYDRIMRELE